MGYVLHCLGLGRANSSQPGVYGYGKDPYAPKKVISPLASARSLNKTINENFGSLVFCRRYLERLGVGRYLAGVSVLVMGGYDAYLLCR